MNQALTGRLTQWRDGGEYHPYGRWRVFVRRAGTGPVLLMLHGYPTGSFDWYRVWDQLARSHTLVAPDMLGLGLSDKPLQHPYRIADHADLLDWLINHLGIRQLFLVAHDLGVTVAQEMLARHMMNPGTLRIEGVVLLNGGLVPAAYRPRAIQRLLASPIGAWLGPHIGRKAFDRSLQLLFAPAHPPAHGLLDDLWSLLQHDKGLRVAHRVGRFWRERMSMSDRLLRPLLMKSTPTLLINGALDPNSGWHMAQHFLSLVPDAAVVKLDDGGHWPQFDFPEDVASLIERFVKSTQEKAALGRHQPNWGN